MLSEQTIMRSKFALCLILIGIVSCGGGSGGSSGNGATTAAPTTPTPPPNNSLFAQAGVQLEDPRSYYTCTDALFQNMIDTVDLNGDGKLDIVAHYWCNQWNKTTSFMDPTPNSLVVYISQPDGSYKIGNTEIFGTRLVDLGGASRKSRVVDLNNDGYLDIFYAINHEDGRPSNSDNSNQYAQAAVVLSQGKGSYKVDRIGPLNWYHAIDIASNSLGGYDAVANGFANKPVLGFRYIGGQAQIINDYPILSGLTFSFINNFAAASTQLVTGGLQSAAQLQLFTKNNGTWTETSSYLFPSKTVPYTTWSGSPMEATTITNGNDDLVAAGFDETCITKLSPSGNSFVIGRMSAYVIAGGYKSSMGRIQEGTIPSYHSLIPYEIVGNQIVRRDGVIVGEDTSIPFNKYECKDVNADGYIDIVGYPLTLTGKTVLYLNDRNGRWNKYSSSEFPAPPSCYGEAGTRMADLNGDGFQDLVMFRSNPAGGTCGSAPIMIFYGQRRF